MQAPTRLDQLVQYTNVAASTAREIANAANIPLLQVTAALTVTILNAIQTVRSNREQFTLILEHIYEILCTIVRLYSNLQTDGTLPPAVQSNIAKFTKTLQKTLGFLKMQQGMGKIKQLFKQFNTATQLKQCQDGLQSSLETFRLQTSSATIDNVSQMQHDAQRQHEELLDLLATHPDLTNSDRSSVAGALSTLDLGNSSASLSLLPPYPQIFHGRESELEQIVETLGQDSARIAVLGTGGMGKTSLAVAVLHQKEVEAKFANRFFIPCHSIATRTDLVSSIALHVGVPEGPNLARKVSRYFSDALPTLLVLDNFETPWESTSSRTSVEEFLSLLADIPHLALLVTMRGAERPRGVKWTRPFLLPLDPLDDSAAMQTFLDIADDDSEQSRIRELLGLTGNLPLAVNLIAHVVAYEGFDATLARWKTENTRVLSDGYDKKTSLDISIMLSFSSARMTAEAQDLASILSMLPDGLSDAELVQSNLPIENILAAKATLIRNSLAFIDNKHRLCALVPIRDHIRATHPPLSPFKFQLRKYFRDLIQLWKDFPTMPSSESVLKISANLGNINTLMADGLNEEASDILATLASMVVFSGFCRMKSNDTPPIMARVAELIMRFPKSKVYGNYFLDRFFASRHAPIKNPEAQIVLANQYFDNAGVIDKAQWNNALGAYYSAQGKNLQESIRCREKAIALTESFEHPVRQRLQATEGLAQVLCTMGNYSDARAHAQSAQEMAEIIGDLLEQAQAVGIEARCCLSLGDFKVASRLCRRARDLLGECGLQGTDTDFRFQNFEAEIHHLKTEYPEARASHELVLAARQAHSSAFHFLNLATIDTSIGAESALVRRNLDAARLQFTTVYASPHAVLLCDAVSANLLLRDGDIATARSMFERVVANLNMGGEGATFCLERLADLDTGMYDTQATLRWAGLYLGSAVRSKNKLSLIKALRCLGQIAAVEGDQATAFNLFHTALDQFTSMGVHLWRADCMVRIADILVGRGEILEQKELLQSARALFDRCKQKHKVMAVDDKLRQQTSNPSPAKAPEKRRIEPSVMLNAA